MNFKRKRFLDLLEHLEHLARGQGCEFVVVNQESLSPEQEMVEDLLAIVHSFSCRLYGMHQYKKQIKDDYPQSSRIPRNCCRDHHHSHSVRRTVLAASAALDQQGDGLCSCRPVAALRRTVHGG